ncbi:MAG: hypothetical protein Q7N50_15240 [Armatimonadota bacterium]|nr:hypothetical protein [Armatimonadota bacterium]
MKSKLARLMTVLAVAVSFAVAATSAYAIPISRNRDSADRGLSRSKVMRRGDGKSQFQQRHKFDGRTFRRRDSRFDTSRRYRQPGFRYHRPGQKFYRHRGFFIYRPFYFSSPFYRYPFGYYGYPYRSYGYYGDTYGYTEPEPPVWTPPAPVKIADDVVARWIDPVAIEVTWTGDPRDVSSVEVAILDSFKRTLRHRTLSTPPYTFAMDIPDQGEYVRIRVIDLVGIARSEQVVSLPVK